MFSSATISVSVKVGSVLLLTQYVDNCATVSNTRAKALMVIDVCQVVLGSGGDDDGFLLLGLELVHHKVVWNRTL